MGSWFNAMFSASCTATGWGQDEDRRCAHDAGFDHHMVKPVDVQTLLEVPAGVEAPPPPPQRSASSPLSGSGTSLAIALKKPQHSMTSTSECPVRETSAQRCRTTMHDDQFLASMCDRPAVRPSKNK